MDRMNLYLMRHAEAERPGGVIKTDAERPITAYGRFQAETIAEELKRRGISPLVVTSPLKRTLQTAEILCASLGAAPFRQEEKLAATGHAPDLLDLLHAYSEAEHLLLIGHQPDIGMLVEQILGFELGFSTAAIAAFESRHPSGWKFLWTCRPEDLMKRKRDPEP